MDRIARVRKTGDFWRPWGALALLALALAAVPSVADTVMAPPPPKQKPQPGETYPESRFGAPPAKPDLGVGQSYAAKQVEDMETPDEGVPSADATADAPAARAPAGIMMKNVSPEAESSTVLRKGVQEVAIIAGDLGFFPKTLFVSRDVPVRMFVTGASKNTLCIMMDSFQVRKQVRSQKIEEITFTPNVPGKYRFYCPVNGMEGSLIVRELASGGDKS